MVSLLGRGERTDGGLAKAHYHTEYKANGPKLQACDRLQRKLRAAIEVGGPERKVNWLSDALLRVALCGAISSGYPGAGVFHGPAGS